MINSVLVKKLRGNNLFNYLFNNVFFQCFVFYVGRVLGRKHDGMHPYGFVVFILNSHLRLGIGPEVLEQFFLARLGNGFYKPVGKMNGKRHKLFRFIACITEHHTLVSRTLFFVKALAFGNALRNIGRLLMHRHQNPAALRIEAEIRIVIADFGDGLTNNALNVNDGLAGDFARNDHEARGHQGLAGNAGVSVLRKHRVEDGVGNLVADLIGMSLRHAFGSKQIFHYERLS